MRHLTLKVNLPRQADAKVMMREEAVLQNKFLEGVDHLSTIDERGQVHDSVGLSKEYIEKLQVRGLKTCCVFNRRTLGFDPKIRKSNMPHGA